MKPRRPLPFPESTLMTRRQVESHPGHGLHVYKEVGRNPALHSPAVAPPTGLELPVVMPLQAEECDQDPPEMHKTARGLQGALRTARPPCRERQRHQ